MVLIRTLLVCSFLDLFPSVPLCQGERQPRLVPTRGGAGHSRRDARCIRHDCKWNIWNSVDSHDLDSHHEQLTGLSNVLPLN